VNQVSVEATELGKPARLQASEMGRNAEIRKPLAEELLDSFCSRKVFAIDQMQRGNESRASGVFAWRSDKRNTDDRAVCGCYGGHDDRRNGVVTIRPYEP
jgi:hypothetical protein